MQKNYQPDNRFLQEMGILLAARAGQGPQLPLPSITHLADYVTSARSYQKLTRAALAQKMGATEAKIYALEHGLLSYTELDLHFLIKLAVALNEDIETLLLLLGRPTSGHLIQTQSAHKKQKFLQRLAYQLPLTGAATASKRHGNRFDYKQWINALYKGCLNLMDSLQQGRLSSYRRVNYQWYSIAAMLVCLIGVSTYSLSGRFGAQSVIQPYRMSLSETSVARDVSDEAFLLSTLTLAVEPGIGGQPSQRWAQHRLYQRPESLVQTSTAPVGGPATALLLSQSTFDETQQCDVRTTGRFALCRV